MMSDGLGEWVVLAGTWEREQRNMLFFSKSLFAGYRIASWSLSVFSISVSAVTTLIQSQSILTRSIQTLPPTA